MALDIFLFVVLAYGAWSGWSAGALTMVLSLAILIAAGLIASAFAVQAGAMLRIGPAFAHTVIGFLFVFIVLMLAGSFIKRAIKPKHGVLRGLDGIVGLILGVIRNAFILSIILLPISMTHLFPQSLTERSVLYPIILKTSTPIVGVFRQYIGGEKK